jgi:hypothetical protein
MRQTGHAGLVRIGEIRNEKKKKLSDNMNEVTTWKTYALKGKLY